MSTLGNTFTGRPRNAAAERARNIKLIEERLQFYAEEIEIHPIVRLLSEGRVAASVLHDCAAILFRSSVLSVPLLSLLKDRVNNECLKRAFLDNLLYATGANGTSIVELCSRFLRSVQKGLLADGVDHAVSLPPADLDEMVFVSELSQAELTGWLLASEVLTPVTRNILLEGFRHLHDIDLEFFKEHVATNSEEHSRSITEAAHEILEETDCIEQILSGIQTGAQAELNLLDSIYAKNLRALKTFGFGKSSVE